jgi:hypothetical protein
MTNQKKLGVEPALQLHKQFLQAILQEIMKVFESGNSGVDRLIKGLRTYWDANFEHRATRSAVQVALAGTPYESNAETMGRPFLMMMQAELQASQVLNFAALAQTIFEKAREIALEEVISGEKQLDQREKLIAHIESMTRKA